MHSLPLTLLTLGAALSLGQPLPIQPTAGIPPVAQPAPRNLKQLLFIVREPHEDWRHPTGQDQPHPASPLMPSLDGNSSVCRLDLTTGHRDILLQVDHGDIQSAQLTPDASQLILSIRFGSPGQPYHLYALPLPPPQQPAGSNQLHQLTHGPYDDIDPTSLPNGQILFGSNPDRTRYRNLLAPLPALSLLEVRPIPGSQKIIGILRPAIARTREKGWLAVMDPALSPSHPEAIRLLGIDPDRIRQFTESPTSQPAAQHVLHVEHPEFRWRNPYPLNEDQILVTTDHAICLVNDYGASTTLYTETELPGELACVMPIVPAAPTDDRGAAL